MSRGAVAAASPPLCLEFLAAVPRVPRYNPVVASAPPAGAQGLYVGTSGWAYPTWKPGFYPKDVPSRAFLHYYASQLSSVEVNYTFRALPSRTQLEGWLAAVPEGFRFSFKAPQRITHFSRLRECQEPFAAFATALEPARAAGKLGPALIQLPPNFAANVELLAEFLRMTSASVLTLAFEFRHASWFAEPVYEALRSFGAALCIAESDELQTPDIQTAAFRYYRLRCPGGYSDETVTRFAEQFASPSRAGETFVYFKHEDEPTGALNATAMLKRTAPSIGGGPTAAGNRA